MFLSRLSQSSENVGTLKLVTSIQPSVAFQIETSQFCCTTNQETGFYMKCNNGLKWVNELLEIVEKPGTKMVLINLVLCNL